MTKTRRREVHEYLKGFIETLRQRLTTEKVTSYVRFMENFRLGRIGKQELVESVVSLLEHDQDLLSHFLGVFHGDFTVSNAEETGKDEGDGGGKILDGSSKDCIKIDADHDDDGTDEHNEEEEDDDDEEEMAKIRRMVKNSSEELEVHVTELTKMIGQRLSREKVRSYSRLMEDFRFRRIGKQELAESVLSLLEHAHDLQRSFREFFHSSLSLSDSQETDNGEGEGGDKIRDGSSKDCVKSDAGHDDEHDGCEEEEPNNGDNIDDHRDHHDDIDHRDQRNDEHETVNEVINDEIEENLEKDGVLAEDEMKMIEFEDFKDKIKKIGLQRRNKRLYQKLMKIFPTNRDNKITPHELKEKIRTNFSDRPDLIKEILAVLPNPKQIPRENAIRSRKKMRKGLQIRFRARVTPSYKDIPEENRSSLSNPELNNAYLSVGKISRRGWYQRRQSAPEKAMFKCEDEMHEADMVRENLQSAINKAEMVLKGKMKMDKVGTLFYRCIERLYAESGKQVVKDLKREPEKVLRVILPRLKQKLRKATLALENQKHICKKLLEENSKQQEDPTETSKKTKHLVTRRGK